jgi:Flp pilus assembly pilin Flp
MVPLLRRLAASDSGQGLVEYAMLICLVAFGVAVVLTLFGRAAERSYDRTGSALTRATVPYQGGSPPPTTLPVAGGSRTSSPIADPGTGNAPPEDPATSDSAGARNGNDSTAAHASLMAR